ncbi:helix-turn-helix domain-containing protein [Salsuginibacillus kocurii]|uniref:helix-turn-helix domain-containing protein n=1 Tax=Salsuginibacillus kocurii TaxID=427078 RepID=UPI000376AACF|nr:helix-turn-helix transcriptional regulator [Salsuginibacillus kocurii]
MKVEELRAVSRHMFSDFEDVQRRWQHVFTISESIEEIEQNSQSLMALRILIHTIQEEHRVPLEQIASYKEQIEPLLRPFVDLEVSPSSREELIASLMKEDNIEAGSSFLYHKLREAISMNQFEAKNGVPQVEIEHKGDRHVAEIHMHTEDGLVLNNAEVEQWETLMTQAITSMDDLTADAFDIISIMWMQSAEHEHDMVPFSHEDVLKLRAMQKKKNGTGHESFRKRDRDEVMKRLAALASIWIRVDEEDEVQLIDQDEVADYKKARMKRLFQVDNVTVARDRKTDEMIGIYECDIRPSDLLAGYLRGAGKSTGMLSLRALQYNPNKHKYHKRLTRYLSWQWRIRAGQEDYGRPYKIGGGRGLLAVMGMELNNDRPFRTKESFEKTLDTLQDDGVIAEWRYVEIDEEKIGKGNPGWLQNYWLQLQVIILPPADLKASLASPSILGIPDMSKLGEQLDLPAPEEVRYTEVEQIPLHFNESMPPPPPKVSAETVKEARESRGLSIKRAAKEIGIAHTTLSRYERGMIKKPNRKNDEKIKDWLMAVQEA